VAGAVGRRPKVASGLAVVIAEGAGHANRPPEPSRLVSFSGASQQSRSAVRPVGLAPSACWAAVGWPCICFCASCEDVATDACAAGSAAKVNLAIIPYSAFVFAWHQAQRFMRPSMRPLYRQSLVFWLTIYPILPASAQDRPLDPPASSAARSTNVSNPTMSK